MNKSFVIIHNDEWKKSDVDEPVQWAKTKEWLSKKWSSDSEGWDHDHCQVCWWKLYESNDSEHGTGFHNIENDN